MDLVKIKTIEEFRWGGGEGRATTSVQRNQRISGKATHVGSTPARHAFLHLFVSR
jgi:hypothetical protein